MLSPNLLPMFPLFPNKNWKNRDSKTYNRIMFYSDIVELTQVIKQFFEILLKKSFFVEPFSFCRQYISIGDCIMDIIFLNSLTGSF